MAETHRITLASLSAETLREVLVRLPVDARARAAAVCRLWRDILADRSLWTRLDLSDVSGVARTVTDAVLRGAAAKAGGGLTVLKARDGWGCSYLTHRALLEVVTANAGALTELCVEAVSTVEQLETLLHAAPLLRQCLANVGDSGVAVGRLLRNEPPFGPFRIAAMLVAEPPWPNDVAAMRSFATELSAHPSSQLTTLIVIDPPPFEDGAFDALVDNVLARQLRAFEVNCLRSAVPAESLARLLGCKSLNVTINGSLGNQLLLFSGMEHAEPLLTAALSSNNMLDSLDLKATGLFSDTAAAEAMIRALTVHPTISELKLHKNPVAVAERARIGASLRALVAANAPQLTFLDLSDCNLCDEGLGPLVDALKVNTHLGVLCCDGNNISDTFVLKRLLPAILANSTIHYLRLIPLISGDDAALGLRVLQELVSLRFSARMTALTAR